jgi:membrane dipeptidase
MSIYVPVSYEDDGARAYADELIDSVEEIVATAPDKFALAYNVEAIHLNAAAGLISLPMGIENGAPLEGDLANLRHFYDRGVRYITLAHSKANHIAESSFDEERPWGGLSEFGFTVIEEMNRLGIMVDVSHISDAAFEDVMAISESPVIASHSSARRFTPGFERNMSDEMIVEMTASGGVIQINASSFFLTPEASTYLTLYYEALDAFLEESGVSSDSEEVKAFRAEYLATHSFSYARLEDILIHIDHVISIAGVDHVGIGSDFEGAGDTFPTGFKDVSYYPALIDGLLARGYSEADIEKIVGGNLLRVWSEVEAYALARPEASAR